MAKLVSVACRRRCVSILRCSVVIATSVVLVTSQVTAAAMDEKQPSAAEIVRPVANAYQQLQQALVALPQKAPPTPQEIAERVDKLFPMLEQADKQISRDTFDPQAIINKTGKDPKKIFEWVRDHTYFVPYRGLLRGDKGVLMDRLGNSLDRAMLLYSLLQFAGEPARMAHGTLSEAQAQNILRTVRPFPTFEQRTSQSSSAAGADAMVIRYTQENHLDALRIRKALAQLAAQQQRTKEMVQKRVAIQSAMIAAAIGPPPANAAADERAEQVRSITDHWWVQFQNSSNWTNLDPTLPGSLLGQTLTSVQNTVAPKGYMDVGENLVHTVEIRVVIEVWKQGQVKEATAFSQKLVPADIIGEPIVLRQIPLHWPQDLNLFQEKDPVAAFKKAALAQTEWLPILSVGPNMASKYSFNDHGDLGIPGQPLAQAEEQGVGGLGGAIGGMLGSHQIAPAPKPALKAESGQVTAEWIDYTIQTPGKQPKTIRRKIFDLIGPAVRRASGSSFSFQTTEAEKLTRTLTILDSIDMLPQVAQVSPEFIAHLTDERCLASRKAISQLLMNSRRTDAEFVSDHVPSTPFISTSLYNLAISRFGFNTEAHAVYLDSINIFTYHRRPKKIIGGSLVFENGFDIVTNDMAVSVANRNPFSIRLKQGVSDTNAEAVLLDGTAEIANVANAFAEATASGTMWRVVRKKDEDAAWRSLGIQDDIRTQLESEINHGYTVLLAPKDRQLRTCANACWWRVDPRNGATLGRGPEGWGQSTTEHVLTIAHFTLNSIIAIHCAVETSERGCGLAATFCMIGLWLPLSGFPFVGLLTEEMTFHMFHLIVMYATVSTGIGEVASYLCKGNKGDDSSRPAASSRGSKPSGPPNNSHKPQTPTAAPANNSPSGPPWQPKPGSTPPPRQSCRPGDVCPPDGPGSNPK